MKTILKLVCVSIGLLGCSQAKAEFKYHDSLLNKAIQDQFENRQVGSALCFPNSVKRFYSERKFGVAWLKPQNGAGRAWQAMLMIDCVLQFGLSHKDYHPKELLYNSLHDFLDNYNNSNTVAMARYDILLTDAIITLMNHLHYGKLNPNYTPVQIDLGMVNKFQADLYLSLIIDKKGLMENIASVQPRNKRYTEMQAQMHLLKGLYLDDCYEVPEADVRQLAINMERLRWAEIEGSSYILVNIPSYLLELYQADTVYQFKVVVGKPGTPTPSLQSTIRYFTTAPEWRVPAKIFARELLPKARADSMFLQNNHYAIYDKKGHYVEANAVNYALINKNTSQYRATQSAGCDNALGLLVFRFNNIYDVYLHDTPEQKLFRQEKRALSHGCIRVEYAQKLAVLLLKNEMDTHKSRQFSKAIIGMKTLNFVLETPMPLKIVYLTCEMQNGLLVRFDDVYDLDSRLEMELYGVNNEISKR